MVSALVCLLSADATSLRAVVHVDANDFQPKVYFLKKLFIKYFFRVCYLLKTHRKQRLNYLKHRSDFLRVASSRKAWIADGLILQVSQRVDTTENLRVGFTASKKVGGAVQRNRIKRRLRSLAHTILEKEADTSLDYVLIGRQQTLLRPFDRLCSDLRFALHKLNVRAN